MKYALFLLAFLGLAVSADAAVTTRLVEYSQGGTVLEGYLAWDDTYQRQASRHPGGP